MVDECSEPNGVAHLSELVLSSVDCSEPKGLHTYLGICRPAVEPEADAPQQPLGKAQVLLNLDTAAAVGLMPEKLQQLPRWCNDDFCEAVRNSQVGNIGPV